MFRRDIEVDVNIEMKVLTENGIGPFLFLSMRRAPMLCQ